MITSPCRSTKCSAAITKPSVDVSQGVNQSNAAANAQSAHWTSPPSAPPTRTSAAAATLKGTDPKDRPHLRERRPAHVHPCMQRDDREVADPEREPLALVGFGNRERDHEKRAHAADEEQPMPEVVGGDGVREPGVAVVHPPDHGEHHDDLSERGDVPACDQHGRQLRDREDEDEVEEELERRDALGAIRLELGHARIIAWPTDAGSDPTGLTPSVSHA